MTIGSHQRCVGKSQTHITPPWVIERLGHFDLDPCAAPVGRPFTYALHNWTEGGLEREWFGRVWLNPPFDRYQVGRWVQKLAQHGNGIALLHARTEAAWFEPIWSSATALRNPGFDGVLVTARTHIKHRPLISQVAAE